MKKLFHFGMLLVLFLGIIGYAMPVAASTPQSYNVLVGSENTSMGASIMSYFPHTVQIHVGDSITWMINSHELHTVTFLAGTTLPALFIPAPSGLGSPLQVNPKGFFTVAPLNGQYDGTTYANSGFMTLDGGAVTSFKLTFTRQGTFNYECFIHGMMMSGTIQVVAASVTVPTPAQVQTQAQAEMKAAWLTVPTVLAKADAQIVPPVRNSDGTLTHTIIMGYSSGNVDVMRFFPSQDTVKPGDTVVWKLSSTDIAPHTVTFYNGNPDQPLIKVVQGLNGLVALINPALLFPSPAVLQGKPLNNTDFFSSGIMMPGGHTTFALKVGNISGSLSYECAIHDTSGMIATLFVEPR